MDLCLVDLGLVLAGVGLVVAAVGLWVAGVGLRDFDGLVMLAFGGVDKEVDGEVVAGVDG